VDLCSAAGFQERGAELVGSDHYARRLGKLSQPAGEVGFVPFPRTAFGRAAGDLKGIAGMPVGRDALGKRLSAALRPVLAANAHEAEVAKAAFEQVLGTRAADGGVIDVYEREPTGGHDAQHINGRQPDFRDGPGDFLVLDAGNDAVAIPAC
jgi:hypothetical protein